MNGRLLRVVTFNGVLIRPMRPSDVDDYCLLRLDKDVQRGLMGFIKTRKDAIKNFKKLLLDTKKKPPTRELFVIELDHRMIGLIDLHDLHQEYYGHKATIGYFMHPSYRGRGITTEAVKAVTKYGMKKYKLRRIEGWCRTYNKASARVLEKAGYELEGILRKHKCKNGKFLDDMLWAYVR